MTPEKQSRSGARSGPDVLFTPSTFVVKFPKPKILLIDMPSACGVALREAGYNVTTGTFGKAYTVPRSNSMHYVPLTSVDLPNYTEQEIVIANTARPAELDIELKKVPGPGVDAYWQVGDEGVIDPRPLSMTFTTPQFDKIKRHGGVFIVFVSGRYEVRYVYGAFDGLRLMEKDSETDSNWDFLGALSKVEATRGHGYEIDFKTKLFRRAAAKAEFYSTLVPNYAQKARWLPIAMNKYDEVVGAILYDEPPAGPVVILPQMPEAHLIMVELVEWCAEWSPGLFPHLEGAKWVHRAEYEIPDVLDLKSQIERVRLEAETQAGELEKRVDQIREQNPEWYTLLRGTGDELKVAVIRSLRKLGFGQVIDVDEQAKAGGDEGQLREDIQVHDRSPILIVDVKGVAGRPDDEESLQAEKHALMRLREWTREGKAVDVQPLTIINYQRNLPPHDRDVVGYRDEIVKNAEASGLGLMSTWDLFRMLRNAARLRWPPEMVLPIVYRTGRIEPLPEHYHLVGSIKRLWKPAFSVVLASPVAVGDRLAVEADDTFEEFRVESLRVNNESVKEATAEAEVTVGFPNASERFREKARVFVIEGERRPKEPAERG